MKSRAKSPIVPRGCMYATAARLLIESFSKESPRPSGRRRIRSEAAEARRLFAADHGLIVHAYPNMRAHSAFGRAADSIMKDGPDASSPQHAVRRHPLLKADGTPRHQLPHCLNRPPHLSDGLNFIPLASNASARRACSRRDHASKGKKTDGCRGRSDRCQSLDEQLAPPDAKAPVSPQD